MKLDDELEWDDGVESRAVIDKQHLDRGITLFQVKESSVHRKCLCIIWSGSNIAVDEDEI